MDLATNSDYFLIQDSQAGFHNLEGEYFLRERDHWGDQDLNGRIILRWIFRKWEGVVWTGRSWLRIGTGGGRL